MNGTVKKYLPVGTVVLLKKAKKRVMVIGFAVTSKELNGRIYDYIGCLYPEGVLSLDKSLVFDHEQIDKIFFMGYSDDENKQIQIKLNEIVLQNSNVIQKMVETMDQDSYTEYNKLEQRAVVPNSVPVTNDLFSNLN